MNYILKSNNEDIILNNKLDREEIIHTNLCLKKNIIFWKSQIDEIPNNELWDMAKKCINKYETNITLFKKHKPAYKRIISRAYFKLLEILIDYKSIFDETSMFNEIDKSAHIAEGPGGFIQSFVDHCNNKIGDVLQSKIAKYTITLYPKSHDDLETPLLKFTDEYESQNNIIKSYGKDNTGDIYTKENRDYFINLVGRNSCRFVTADGGFDFSNNFNTQEEMFNTMLISEILLILQLQKQNGVAIIKVFDMLNLQTRQIIFLLSLFYNTMYVTKPLSSRPANSEKYIVCSGYNNTNKDLPKIINMLENILNKNQNNIIDEDMVQEFKEFDNIITQFNSLYTTRQIMYLSDTLDVLNKLKQMTQKEQIMYKQIHEDNNKKYCERWCKKYKIN